MLHQLKPPAENSKNVGQLPDDYSGVEIVTPAHEQFEILSQLKAARERANEAVNLIVTDRGLENLDAGAVELVVGSIRSGNEEEAAAIGIEAISRTGDQPGVAQVVASEIPTDSLAGAMLVMEQLNLDSGAVTDELLNAVSAPRYNDTGPRGDMAYVVRQDDETVGNFLDGLRQPEGSNKREMVKNFAEYLGQAQLRSVHSGEEESFLSIVRPMLVNREDLVEQLAQAMTDKDVDDWDRLGVALAIESVADETVRKNFSWDPFEPVNSTPDDQRNEEQARAKAASLRSKAGIVLESSDVLSSSHARRMIHQLERTYSGMRTQGITVERAVNFESFVRTYPGASEEEREPTPQEILEFSNQFEDATELTRQVLEHNRAHVELLNPYLLLSLDDYLARVGKGKSNDQSLEDGLRFVQFLIGHDDSSDTIVTAREAIDDLLVRGVNILSVQRFMGKQETLVEFHRLAESEGSRRLIATLAMQKGVDLDAGRIIQAVSQRPDMYEAAVVLVDQELASVLDSGYPANMAQKAVNEVFGEYFGNRFRIDGENGATTIAEQYRQHLGAKFHAMRLVGSHSVEVERLIAEAEGRSLEERGDRIVDEIWSKIMTGEHIEQQDFIKNVYKMAEEIKALAEEHPELFSDLVKYGIETVGGVDSIISRYQETTKNGWRMASDYSYLKTILANANVFEPGYAAVASVFNLKQFDRESGKSTIPEGAYAAIEDIRVVRESPYFDELETQGLMALFFNRSTLGHSKEARELLFSDAVQDTIGTERGVEQLNTALSVMGNRWGRYDFARASKLTRSLNHASRDYLADIIYQESALSHQEAKNTFYELATQYLPKVDKNGFPYDSPRIIGDVVEKHTKTQDSDGKEIFAWFAKQDTLPLAAFDLVAHFRDQARLNGVNDTPRAVYEWVHEDLEKVAELSDHNTRNYVAKLLSNTQRAQTANLSFRQKEQLSEVVIEKARELAASMSNDARVFLNIHPDALAAVVDSGGVIKSTFDTDGQRYNNATQYTDSTSYMQVRSGVEIALGIRSLDEEVAHPVYGSLGYVGDGVPAGASGYGDVMLSFRLDDQLDRRTTFTPEDSLHGAHRLNQRDALAVRIIKNAFSIGSARTNDYVETQIVGGLTLDGVDAVYVTDEAMKLSLPESLRVRVVVRPRSVQSSVDSDGTYRGVLEKKMWAEARLQNFMSPE